MFDDMWTHLECVPTLHYLEAPKVLLLLVASTTLAFDSNCLNSFNFGVASYKSACEKFMGHRTKRFFQWSGKMGERF